MMRRRSFLMSLLAMGGRRVYLQNVSETGATVCWSGEGDFVEFGDGARAEGVWRNGHWEARLTGLRPGQVCSYRVGSYSGAFAAAGGGDCDFLVIGDTGSGSEEQGELAGQLVRERADFLIHTGDVAYPTGQAEAYEQRYLDYYHSLMGKTPFFPCPGNHDYYDTAAEPYFAFHDWPESGVSLAERGRYYSFVWGDATVISIDSNAPLEDARRRAVMLDWLERTLGASTTFWRVVFFHHPPMAAGPNQDDVMTALAREFVVPILERHRVQVVFNGHEHSYQRSVPRGGTVYFTTGGGGAPLYPVGSAGTVAMGASEYHYLRGALRGTRMTVEAVGLGGRVLDRTTLAPGPEIKAVVNAASCEARIGRGSPVSIFGWNLGSVVYGNGRRLEVLAATARQVNVALPGDLTGPVRFVVESENGRAEFVTEVRRWVPAVFPGVLADGGGVYVTGLMDYDGEVRVRVESARVTGRLVAGPVEGVQLVRFAMPVVIGKVEVAVEAAGEVSNRVMVG